MKVGELTLYNPFGQCCDIFVGPNGLLTMVISQGMMLLVNAAGFVAITLFLGKDVWIKVVVCIMTTICSLAYVTLCIGNPGVPQQIIDKVKGRVPST